MPYSGEDHSYIMLISHLDNLFIPYRAPGLDDSPDAMIGGQLHSISKGEEGIRAKNAALSSLPCPLQG